MKYLTKAGIVSIPLILLFVPLISLHKLQEDQRETRSIDQPPQSERNILGVKTPDLPARLIIPKINVDAKVEYVGITEKGEMDVPSNTVNVGWYKLGPLPGVKGSAVIDGHLDGSSGGDGVFNNLHKLKVGDKLYIEDINGASTVFVVREKRTYDPGYAPEVFSLGDQAYLNLVTCGGTWDEVKKSYSKRLVVFTEATDGLN